MARLEEMIPWKIYQNQDQCIVIESNISALLRLASFLIRCASAVDDFGVPWDFDLSPMNQDGDIDPVSEALSISCFESDAPLPKEWGGKYQPYGVSHSMVRVSRGKMLNDNIWVTIEGNIAGLLSIAEYIIDGIIGTNPFRVYQPGIHLDATSLPLVFRLIPTDSSTAQSGE